MASSLPPFDYPSSLQEYAIPEGDYLLKHQDVHIICTGAVVFNREGKLLLVQRAKEEKAFPNLWVSARETLSVQFEKVISGWTWALCEAFSVVSIDQCQEIPGGKMDDTDETVLHAAARELREETGLIATRVVRKVAQFTFSDRPNKTWLKVPCCPTPSQDATS